MNATLLLMASTWAAGAEPAQYPLIALPPTAQYPLIAQPSAVVQAQCCGSAPVAPAPGPCCDSAPAAKQGLFAKLKSRCAKAPAPCATAYSVPCDACSKPAPVKVPHTNLLDKLRDRHSKHKGGPATCGCSCDCVPGCAGPVYGAPIAPGNLPPVGTDPKKPPMEMPPKTTDVKKPGSDAKIPETKVTDPKKPAPTVTDPKSAPEPRPIDPKKTVPPSVTDPKKGNAPEGLNIPNLPSVPQLPGNNGANVIPPMTITPVSAPKMNGSNSPY